MSILASFATPFNPPADYGAIPADDGTPAPPPPTMGCAEWIDAQASYYRSLGTDMGDLLADSIAGLARDWRVAACGRPISVETFRARVEIMAEWAAEVMDA